MLARLFTRVAGNTDFLTQRADEALQRLAEKRQAVTS
jgi:hypothetical protein